MINISLIKEEFEKAIRTQLRRMIFDLTEIPHVGDDDNCKYCKKENRITKKLLSIIQKAREELRKNAECHTSGIHICDKHPEDCDLKVDLNKIEEVLVN